MAEVVVIGSGGREHAFAYTLSNSPDVDKIYCIPGNAGTAGVKKVKNVTLSNEQIGDFAQKNQVTLVVIGPETPLAAGLADELRSQGLTVLGPSAEAAKLEASKAYATEFMQEQTIPIPPSHIVHDLEAAKKVIADLGATNSVIKADGLAGGKGVVLPNSDQEAQTTLEEMFSGKYDGLGNVIVIQQRYHGPEVSAFVLSDGKEYAFIPLLAQDHKRLLEGDRGPNTGGMGAYAPLPASVIAEPQIEKLRTIADKTIKGMTTRNIPYQGILYIGVMLAEEVNSEPIVIEYNARFGDPEAQVILPLLDRHGVDIYQLLLAIAQGKATNVHLPNSFHEAAVTICLAAQGYPEKPQKGEVLYGLEKPYHNVEVFHGGTGVIDDQEVSSGGRVLYVTGFGEDLAQALQAATVAIGEEAIHFQGMQYRKDIGYRAIDKA